MAKSKKHFALDPNMKLDIVATRDGHEPIVKEMTYSEWLDFKPKRGWNYTAYQKNFHSFT